MKLKLALASARMLLGGGRRGKHFPHLFRGVWPSSATASSALSGVMDASVANSLPSVAAPGDGRTLLNEFTFPPGVGAAPVAPLSAAEDFGIQLQSDCDSLKEIVAGLDRLEQQLADAQAGMAARQRGYFTPDEDDRVRQMLLAYRSYRLGIYEIIYRYIDYEQIRESDVQLRAFIVGFAAALTLYAKSLKFIQSYEHEPLVRQKLNEPDAKFGLGAGFFDDVLRGFSSISNYRLLAKANWFWRSRRKDAQDLRSSDACDWRWLAGVIRHQRIVVQKRLLSVLGFRLRYDWRIFWQTTFKPVKQTRYGFQSLIAARFARLRTSVRYQPAINEAILEKLRPTLQPGDVLLVRAEHKLTGALLPGFWAHAAIYLGSRSELRALGLEMRPHVQKHWLSIPEHGGRFGQVIEAISPRAVISPLEKCLFADHVAVLRPNVSAADRAAALAEAFGHLGKPYDFEFDFNVTTRIVCTELIYRCYHGRAGIQFPLVKRLGRFTLSGSDIVSLFLDSRLGSSAVQGCTLSPRGTSGEKTEERGNQQQRASSPQPSPPSDGGEGEIEELDALRSAVQGAPFRLVSLVLKMDDRAHFVPQDQAVHILRQIHSGKRPSHEITAQDCFAKDHAIHARKNLSYA